MRKDVIKGLFNPLDDFCSMKCGAFEKCVVAYLESVKVTGIWPLEHANNISIQKIVDSRMFTKWTCNIPPGACSGCVTKLRGGHIYETRLELYRYWQGLCLDCMDITSPSNRDIDDEYWEHNQERKFDEGCRLTHSRNTWYFSFMGRPEIMNNYQRENQERNRTQARRDLQARQDAHARQQQEAARRLHALSLSNSTSNPNPSPSATS
jgi:hypothetical protein